MCVLGSAGVVVVAAVFAAARAEDSALESALGVARAYVGEQRFDEAADELGRVAARAHQEEDLLAEQMISREIRNLDVAVLSSGASRSDVIARLVGHLDASRLGVFVSAHHLATKLLVDGTDDGDHRHIDVVLRVLERAAARGQMGRGGSTLLHFARAVSRHREASTDDDWIAVEQQYSEALRSARASGFCDLEVCIGLETAAMWRDRGRGADALQALTTAFDVTIEHRDSCRCSDSLAGERRLYDKWSVAMHRRFRGVAGAEQLLARGERASTPGGRGGRRTSDAPKEERRGHGSRATRASGEGGRGLVAGARRTDAEEWWARLRSATRIVTLMQKPAQTEVTVATAPIQRASIARSNRPTRKTCAPITVSADRHQLAVIGVDLEDRLGAPGQTGPELLDAAWYYVADGERLTITRGGVARVR